MQTMAIDDYVTSQFTAINNHLQNINNSIQSTKQAIGRVEGVQNSHGDSLRRIDKRLNEVTKDTQSMVDDLKRTTGEIEIKLHSLASPQNKEAWYKRAFTAENVKLTLMIVAVIVATVLGVSFPFLS